MNSPDNQIGFLFIGLGLLIIAITLHYRMDRLRKLDDLEEVEMEEDTDFEGPLTLEHVVHSPTNNNVDYRIKVFGEPTDKYSNTEYVILVADVPVYIYGDWHPNLSEREQKRIQEIWDADLPILRQCTKFSESDLESIHETLRLL